MKPMRTVADAIKHGYVVMRSSYTISNEFYRYCERTDAPFVRVRLKKTFAMVEVDLIGQSYRMGEVCWQEVHNLLRAYHVGAWPWRLAGRSHTCMYSPRIPLESADAVAKGLTAILNKPGYREPVRRHFSPEVDALDNALRTGTLSPSRSDRKEAHHGITF